MIVVDASVWVSRFVPQDVHHATSRRWLENTLREGELIAAPLLLLAEVSGAIARRTDQTGLGLRAMRQLLNIPGLRLVRMDERLGVQAAQIAADWRLRGADAMYAAVAHDLDIPLVSWDSEQVTRLDGLLNAYTPDP